MTNVRLHELYYMVDNNVDDDFFSAVLLLYFVVDQCNQCLLRVRNLIGCIVYFHRANVKHYARLPLFVIDRRR